MAGADEGFGLKVGQLLLLLFLFKPQLLILQLSVRLFYKPQLLIQLAA
jgi:hypothetical protein